MAAAAKPSIKSTPTPTAYSFRTHRTGTYSWQAYKVTTFSDGSFKEEPVFKEDVLNIVMTKITAELRKEGQIDFLTAKQKQGY